LPAPLYKKHGDVYFTLQELQKSKASDAVMAQVDPKCRESYLCDDEFVKVFKMSRAEFSHLAPWKQANLKKEVGLF